MQFEEAELIERIFFSLVKQLNIFLQSVAKKEDVFGIFTDWPRQEFDLPDAKNFKCSTVIFHAVGVNNEGQGRGAI